MKAGDLEGKLLQLQKKMKVSCCVRKGAEMRMGMAYLQRGIEEALPSRSGVSAEQHLRPSSTQRDPLVLGEPKQQLEERVGVGGVGEGVGEGLPALVQHAAVGVSDLDAVVAHGVVGGGDDEPGGGPAELGGAERGEDGGAADGGRHGGAVSAEARRAVGEPGAAGEREAGGRGKEAPALLLVLIGGHGAVLGVVGSDLALSLPLPKE
jgi:hypothetical protein